MSKLEAVIMDKTVNMTGHNDNSRQRRDLFGSSFDQDAMMPPPRRTINALRYSSLDTPPCHASRLCYGPKILHGLYYMMDEKTGRDLFISETRRNATMATIIFSQPTTAVMPQDLAWTVSVHNQL